VEQVGCQQLQGHDIQIIAGQLDINGVNSSSASISHLKAAAPIRLIDGGVSSPKNSGSGSPRKVKSRHRSRRCPGLHEGLLMGGGTEELVSPGP